MSIQFKERTVIAHRGACAVAPENTLAAFDRALAMGAQWIEFDVMLSHDQEPFVFHDLLLNRTTNGEGKFKEKDAVYLRSLDAGAWFSPAFSGEKIPHFKDVLKWLLFTNTHANIEIKAPIGLEAQTAEVVMQHLLSLWPVDQPLPLVSSFHLEALQSCRALAPELPIGFLMHTWEDGWQQQASALRCSTVHVNHHFLTRARVNEIKQAGWLALGYTINRKRLAHKLFSWGVDAIFSDYADLCL